MVTRPSGADWVALSEAFQKAAGQPKLQKYRQRRWGRTEEFAGWVAEAVLPAMTKDQAIVLYAASGGRRHGEFKTNTIEDVRESLDFLLYDMVRLEGRFQECAAEGGAYKLAGAGREFVSYVLCLRDPNLFAVWNSSAERALGRVGVGPEALSRGPLGVSYIDVLEASSLVRRRLGLADFRSVDEFSYWIVRASRQGGD